MDKMEKILWSKQRWYIGRRVETMALEIPGVRVTPNAQEGLRRQNRHPRFLLQFLDALLEKPYARQNWSTVTLLYSSQHISNRCI